MFQEGKLKLGWEIKFALNNNRSQLCMLNYACLIVSDMRKGLQRLDRSGLVITVLEN